MLKLCLLYEIGQKNKFGFGLHPNQQNELFGGIIGLHPLEYLLVQ